MRKIFFLSSILAFFLSCKSEPKTEEEKQEFTPEKVDSLPQGKWNGEYLKIEGEEEDRKKRSQGSNYYSMGKASMNIGETTFDFALFDKKRNVLTFTTSSIQAIITNSSGDEIRLRFKKEKIVSNHKGKYKVSKDAEQNGTARFAIKEAKTNQEYKLISGEMEILDFNPRLATFEFQVKGIFTSENDLNLEGNAYFKMNFEEAIMTAEF